MSDPAMERVRRERAATYADLAQVPEGQIAQIVEGELFVLPRPAVPHTITSSAAGASLTGRFQFGDGGPGGWWILDEPELHLGPDVLVPDLAGWRRERLPSPPHAPRIDLVPDWVCEVLSPRSRRIDLIKKARIYARAGVPWFWVIDPVHPTIEARELREGVWATVAATDASEPCRLPPFDAVELDVRRWFLWPEGEDPSEPPRPAEPPEADAP